MIRYAVIPCCITILLSLAISCQAPHDNPLDTQSPNYRVPQPPQPVNTLTADSITSTRCRLSWLSVENAYSYRIYSGNSDWDGSSLTGTFLYPEQHYGTVSAGIPLHLWIDIPSGQTRAWAVFGIAEDGLISDCSNIVIVTAPQRDKEASISLQSWSSHITWWGLPDQVTLNLNVAAADSDGIDSLWITLNEDYIGRLVSSGDGIHWTREFQGYELPTGSIEAAVGYRFSMHHKDLAGFTTLDTTFSIERVIKETPYTSFPSRDTLIIQDPAIILEWLPFESDFSFSYAVDIVHWSDSHVPTIVYEESGISSDSLRHQVGVHLNPQPGLFLWSISVVDEFGNRSRSREASFRVEDDE